MRRESVYSPGTERRRDAWLVKSCGDAQVRLREIGPRVPGADYARVLDCVQLINWGI